jgi:hypothetical protein
MTRDDLLAGALILAFAAFVTSHVALVAGLARVPPRKRALLALFVPPFALYWGFRAGMVVRATLWLASVLAYGALRVLASVT